MTRYLVLAAALAACSGKSNRADSVDAAIPAIDTLKAVTASDTAAGPTPPDSVRTPAPAAKTKTPTPPLGRDSAFPPPRNLPRLDTVKKKP